MSNATTPNAATSTEPRVGRPAPLPVAAWSIMEEYKRVGFSRAEAFKIVEIWITQQFAIQASRVYAGDMMAIQSQAKKEGRLLIPR